MKICSIKVKSSKNANIFLILTDLECYELHSDAIVKFGLAVGDVDDEKFFQALKESKQIIAFNLIAKYLSNSMKTERQIKDYLYKKEFDSSTINAVVEKLKEYGLINDENFALSYIKSNPNYSANKLKQKLFNFGIKKQIVDLVLSDFDNYEGCEKCAVKFMKNKDHAQKTKEKLIRHLLGKGYNWNDVSKMLNLFDFEYDHFQE